VIAPEEPCVQGLVAFGVERLSSLLLCWQSIYGGDGLVKSKVQGIVVVVVVVVVVVEIV